MDAPIKPVKELMAWFRQQSALLEAHFRGKKVPVAEWERLMAMMRVLSGEERVHFLFRKQAPYSFYLPNLLTQCFWPKDMFPWTAVLEENHATIRDEMQSVLMGQQRRFTTYEGDGLDTDKGQMTARENDWKVFYFYQNFVRYDDNHRLCPRTSEILSRLSDRLLYGMVCFSHLEPGAAILPHTGPSNMRLTCHLGLVGCADTFVSVGDETRPYEDGKCVVFDDSYVHSVEHKGTQRRVTLMLDFWHPRMTNAEIEGFRMVMANAAGVINQNQFFHSLGIHHPKPK